MLLKATGIPQFTLLMWGHRVKSKIAEIVTAEIEEFLYSEFRVEPLGYYQREKSKERQKDLIVTIDNQRRLGLLNGIT